MIYEMKPIHWLGGVTVKEGESYHPRHPMLYGKVHYYWDKKDMEQYAAAYPVPVNLILSVALRFYYWVRNSGKFMRPMHEYRDGYELGYKHGRHNAENMLHAKKNV